MTYVAKNTVVKLLCDLGRACSVYQEKAFVRLKCKRVRCDEIGSFVGAKEKNCSAEMKAEGAGDVWTWTAIDHIGARWKMLSAEIDYVMLQKIYGSVSESPETRYSPAICMGARKAVISGNPDHNHVSTSYAERQNLTMRMSMRRFTRLTNGFSKKVENHEHALALYFMYYNFCRIQPHGKLRSQANS
jgi:hypothetical protein